MWRMHAEYGIVGDVQSSCQEQRGLQAALVMTLCMACRPRRQRPCT